LHREKTSSSVARAGPGNQKSQLTNYHSSGKPIGNLITPHMAFHAGFCDCVTCLPNAEIVVAMKKRFLSMTPELVARAHGMAEDPGPALSVSYYTDADCEAPVRDILAFGRWEMESDCLPMVPSSGSRKLTTLLKLRVWRGAGIDPSAFEFRVFAAGQNSTA